jgi:predicted amino acid dehydrogenase
MGFVITSSVIARHMKENNLQPLQDKINDCIRFAEANGCTMIGFGGFTSIITGNCKNIAMDNIAYTTGNSFTTAMGIKAMLAEAPALGIDIKDATFAAVGAAGNIASVYAEFMAQQVRKIILVGAKGRTENISNLALKIFAAAVQEIVHHPGEVKSGIAGSLIFSRAIRLLVSLQLQTINYKELYQLVMAELDEDFPIVVTDDINMIKEANLILSSTNTPDAVIYPKMLGKQPIVICDIALPFDVDTSVKKMSNVKLIKGGVVKIPNSDHFKIGGIRLPKGNAYACLSETLVLGLAGITNNYSYGNISLDQVKQVYQLGKMHGFTLGQSKLECSY